RLHLRRGAQVDRGALQERVAVHGERRRQRPVVVSSHEVSRFVERHPGRNGASRIWNGRIPGSVVQYPESPMNTIWRKYGVVGPPLGPIVEKRTSWPPIMPMTRVSG